jgi:formylglycine-generating enzyme required for sulfatase activity
MDEATRQGLELQDLIGDKHEVLSRIGGGGMAQVFLARHRLHGGLAAIKVLSESLAGDPRIVARFQQEARTAASLAGHPNIVPIFDVGSGNGLHYLVMEYVQGEDMAHYLRRCGPLAARDAGNIIAQVAEALIWAEGRRVVHRDLKPANILLDANGRALVLDFGIAKPCDAANGLTLAGESLGTPYYMSPEQIQGRPCDARSDLYSLGVVFFELLTARRPFEGDSTTAICMAHLSANPPRVGEYAPGVERGFEEIVDRLLQRDPEHRYGSARELLDALRALDVSTGPGALRPEVRPAPAPDPAFRQARATPAVASAAAVPPLPAEAPAEPVRRVAEPGARAARRPRLPGAALALVLALAAVVGGLYALRPKRVLADAHGTMLLVPAGEFLFGENAPDSPRPQSRRYLPSFYVDRTEVSNAEYKRFCDSTGRTPPPGFEKAGADDPVANVTLDDAEAYAAWAGKRLPSEEEWEKAARGNDGRLFPWGDAPWSAGVPTSLQPVSAFPDRQSPAGALNMAGNVYEWTNSPFPAGEREYADMRHVLGTDSFSRAWFSIKGGSFSPGGARFFACYLRRGFPRDGRSPSVGFRCVREVGLPRFLDRLQSVFRTR